MQEKICNSGVAKLYTPELMTAYERGFTETTDNLISAAVKLSSLENGRFWSVIDASLAYGQTAVMSVVRFVIHIALAILSIVTIWSQSGRNFMKNNFYRAFIDLTGFFIGSVGILYPRGAMQLTARQLLFINRTTLDYFVISKDKQEAASNSPIQAISWFAFRRSLAYAVQMERGYGIADAPKSRKEAPQLT
ncbi:MAG: hypothetical protein KR126chlam1_00992 [Chlamydiae bacterium]|nr:hypothetical protein [Chlamydiota bacterium]